MELGLVLGLGVARIVPDEQYVRDRRGRTLAALAALAAGGVWAHGTRDGGREVLDQWQLGSGGARLGAAGHAQGDTHLRGDEGC